MSTHLASGFTRVDAPMFRAIAEGLRPRRWERPSVWAERHVELKRAATGGEFEGAYRCAFYPWLRAWLDVLYDRPHKKGLITPKRSQAGITIATMVLLGSIVESSTGSVLYLIGRKSEAENQAVSRWDTIVDSAPALKARFQRAKDDKLRTLLASRPYDGGRIVFAGAGSASDASTDTYATVVVDEFDQAMANFPSRYGDLHMFVRGRFGAVSGSTRMLGFSHPTLEGVGIDAVFNQHSDLGAWAFNCPHGECDRPIAPTHECIVFRRHDAEARPILGSEVFVCPHCGKEIDDDDRRRLVWGPELGGTGRLWSPMEPKDAAQRDYIGFAINGLCTPSRPLGYFAKLLHSAKMSGDPAVEQSVLNVHFGEAMKKSRAEIRPDHVKRCVRTQARRHGEPIVVPGGPRGVRLLTVGVDVQRAAAGLTGEEKPILYATAVAFSAATAFIVDMRLLSGFDEFLLEYLPNLCVRIEGTPARGVHASPGGGGLLGVRGAAIDWKYKTDLVFDACRRAAIGGVYSRAASWRIDVLPVGYDKPAGKGTPAVSDPVTDPARPHLGPLKRWRLYRHGFVDRVLRRLNETTEGGGTHGGARVAVLCEPPRDFVPHWTSQVLRALRRQHDLDAEQMEWSKPKEFRDDWLQSFAYAEAIAALEYQLDTFGEYVTAEESGENFSRATEAAAAHAARRGEGTGGVRDRWGGRGLRGTWGR